MNLGGHISKSLLRVILNFQNTKILLWCIGKRHTKGAYRLSNRQLLVTTLNKESFRECSIICELKKGIHNNLKYIKQLKKEIKIYYPAQYPTGVSPAQRFRLEQYFPYLEKDNVKVVVDPFILNKTYSFFFKKGHLLQKLLGIAGGFIRRFASLFILYKYDCIFINREASPLGPPVFEWLYCKVFRKKIVFDVDDAVWLQKTSDVNKIAHRLRCMWKFKYIIRWSTAVVAGNRYLAEYANNYNQNVILIPTVVDTETRYNISSVQGKEPLIIGWTGSFSTMEFFKPIIPVLQKLKENFEFKVLIISNAKPDFELEDLIYIPWSEATEVAELQKCQIGLMPTKKDQWSLGKCGFKIIQYMSLGIVPIADSWGANASIIDDQVNGILIEHQDDWESALERLILDKLLRKNLAGEAIIKARNQYSVEANYPKLLSVLLSASQSVSNQL